jgi:hypothetical protein
MIPQIPKKGAFLGLRIGEKEKPQFDPLGLRKSKLFRSSSSLPFSTARSIYLGGSPRVESGVAVTSFFTDFRACSKRNTGQFFAIDNNSGNSISQERSIGGLGG